MATWNSQTFGERPTDGSNFAVWALKLEYTTHHYPGSNNTLTIVGGRGPRELTLPIKCTAAVLSSLIGAVGESHTLATADDSRSATLVEVSDARQVSNSTSYFATLHFIES